MRKLQSNIAGTAFAGALLVGTCLAAVPAMAQQDNVIDVGAQFRVKTIQEALREARSGALIRVHAGEYSGVKIDKDNVTIRSVVPGAAHIVGGGRPAIESYGRSGLTVEGFRLSSDVDGVKVGGSMSGAARGITFQNNTIEGAGGDGMKFFQIAKGSTGRGLTLRNNTIKKAGLSRNRNGDGGIDFVGVDDSVVEGNEVIKTFGHACLMIKGGSDNNKILNNRLLGCERDGITVGGFTDDKFMSPEDRHREAYNNTISGNTVQGGDGKCPFYFNDATNNHIENNRTLGGRSDCDMANGSNNANADVSNDLAGADNAGDEDFYRGRPDGSGDAGDNDMSVSDVFGDNPSCNLSAVAHSIGGGGVSITDVAGGAAEIAVGALTGGIGGIVSGIGGIFGGGSGRASEKMQKVQQVQLFFQSLCDAEQAAQQAKMIASGSYNNSYKVQRGIRRTAKLLEEIGVIDFAGLFPEQYGIMSGDDKIIWDERQTSRQYDASNLSKRTASEASAKSQEMADRINEAIAAAQSAPGPKAVGQAQVGLAAIGLEVQQDQLSSQIAHQQVVEAHLDEVTSAKMRAVEYRKRMRRGLPGYEGDGGLGTILAGEE